MSILYMEGFEDVSGNADLVARGATSDTTTVYYGTKPARYAGGKAIVRGSAAVISVATFRRSLARTLTDGIFFSYQFYRTSYNVGVGLVYPDLVNGRYLAGLNTTSFKSSTDGINWTISPYAGFTPNGGPLNICWDPTRSRYWTTFAPNTASVQPVSSPDLVTWTGQTGISSANGGASSPRITFDVTTNRLWIVTQGNAWALEPGATTWTLTTPTSLVTNIYSALAIDQTNGNRWIMSSNIVYRGTSADTTWTASAALPGNARGIAYGNSIVVVGQDNGASPYYSTDGGATFQASTPIPGWTVNASVYVAFFKGQFYIMNRGGTSPSLYSSVNGATWSRVPATLFPVAGVINGMSATSTHMWITTNQGNFYTTDGLNWSVLEEGTILGSNANVTNGLSSPINAMVRPGIVVNSNDVVYALLSQTSPTSAVTPVTLTKDAWHMLECSLMKTSPGQYQYDLTLDGMPIYSQAFAFADFYAANLGTSGAVNLYPIATNGTQTLLTAGANLYTQVGFNAPASISIAISGSIRDAVWTGKQFILQSDGPIFGSYDGVTWRLLTNTGTAMSCMTTHGNTVISAALSTTTNARIWRSGDGGETWNELALTGFTAAVGTIFYDKGAWFAIPYSASQPWYYSTDDGLTWQPHPTRNEGTGYQSPNRFRAQAFGSTFVNINPPAGGTVSIGRITVNSATDVALSYVNTSGAQGAGARFLGFNGRRLFQHAGTTNPIWYSYDGDTWVSVAGTTTSSNTVGFLPINGCLYFGSTTANAARVVAPELLDHPLDFTFDGYSFSSYDDIIVNDAAAPYSGPLGEGRLIKIPLDTADQSQWAPNPSDLTNVQAATQQTVTTSSAFVESNEAGQKDIYGTSGFSVPPGYRAAAVQVDGFYQRTLNTIPSARLGVRSGTSEDTTPVIPVTSSIGTKAYVSKIIQADPATGQPWSSAAVANAKVTNERVE